MAGAHGTVVLFAGNFRRIVLELHNSLPFSFCRTFRAAQYRAESRAYLDTASTF